MTRISNLLWMIVVVSACQGSERPSGVGDACSMDSPCASGLLCLGQVCHALCNSDTDCPWGNQACTEGTCQLVPNSQCATDDECTAPLECQQQEGARCVAGECEYRAEPGCSTRCGPSEPCPSTQYCDAQGSCQSKATDGQTCPQIGAAGCQSNHCSGGWCCEAGDCCNTPSHCPLSYASPATCEDASLATTCQGFRRVTACIDHMCVAQEEDDDSGCAGAMRDCPDLLAPVTCTDDAEQPGASCLDRCTRTSDCGVGALCAGGSCLAAQIGARCEDDSCDAGMRCENGVCCDENGPPCCEDADHCQNGLACDTVSAACLACVEGTSEGCADPERTYCVDGACVSRLTEGSTCTTGTECLSEFCECGDPLCVLRRCALEPCEACRYTTTGAACDAFLADTPCDDNVGCTVNDTCNAGSCAGEPRDGRCPGGTECEIGVCDPASDCQLLPEPAGTECSNDGDPCTEDVCDGQGGCNVVLADAVALEGISGQCFMLYESVVSQTAASITCQNLTPPGNLVSILSQEEQTVLAALVDTGTRPPSADEDVWLSGTDLAEEGTWLWANDVPIVFNNWREGEPNNGLNPSGQGTVEHCMIVEGNRQDLGASWDDRPCTTLHAFVCQR